MYTVLFTRSRTMVNKRTYQPKKICFIGTLRAFMNKETYTIEYMNEENFQQLKLHSCIFSKVFFAIFIFINYITSTQQISAIAGS